MSEAITQYPDWPDKQFGPAFSGSAENMYSRCPRRWLMNYRPDLTADKWGPIKEKKLEPTNSLVGTIAHSMIEELLQTYKNTGVTPVDQIENLHDACRRRFQEFFVFSKRWTDAVENKTTWPTSDKAKPMEWVFRHEPITKDHAARLIRELTSAIENFLTSPLYDRLMTYDPAWLMLQPKGILPSGSQTAIPWFWANDVPVYASYDLMVITPEETLIIDWKTGNRDYGEETVGDQLNLYAAFAIQHCGKHPDEIELIAAWIGDGTSTTVHDVIPNFVDIKFPRWRSWQKRLQDDVAALEVDRSQIDALFPIVDDMFACGYCVFRSCAGYSRHKNLPHQLPQDQTRIASYEE